MSSHGKVLDLFEEQYLKIQDVTGNIEPFPALVPYSDYNQIVTVYKMEWPLELFMGLLQDFTARLAKHSDTELWTWAVQWDVERNSAIQSHATPPALKKPRLNTMTPPTSTSAQSPQAKPEPASLPHGSLKQRLLSHDLEKEEGILRLLIEIVQTEGDLMPNLIELLYQWIDRHEGDGYALQCALWQEIPTLWDFPDHPVKMHGETDNVEKIDNQKEFEDQSTKSERSQYKEKKFGLQPPKLEIQSVTIPQNVLGEIDRRRQFYMACFVSRQRAISRLLRLGVTMPQIRNYVKNQREHPKTTVEAGHGDGLANYYKEEAYYGSQLSLTQNVREKNVETLISRNLAFEAQFASLTQHTGFTGASQSLEQGQDSHMTGQPSVPPPLIPTTPLETRRFGSTVPWRRNTPSRYQWYDDTIRAVPEAVVYLLNSTAFASTKRILNSSSHRRHPGGGSDRTDGPPDDEHEDSDESDDSLDDELEDSDRDPDLESDNVDSSTQQTTGVGPYIPTLPTLDIAGYLRNMSSEQRADLLRRLHPGVQETLASIIPGLPQGQGSSLGQSESSSENVRTHVDESSGAADSMSIPSAGNQLQSLSSASTAGSTFIDPRTLRLSNSAIIPPTLTVTTPTQSPPGTDEEQQGHANNEALAIQQSALGPIQQTQLSVSGLQNHSLLSPGLQSFSFSTSQGTSSQQAFNLNHPLPADSPPQQPHTAQPTRTAIPALPLVNTLQSNFLAPRRGIQRNPPPPIKVPANNGNNLSFSTNAGTPTRIPVLVFFPKIVAERNVVNSPENTDAVMLGYNTIGSTHIDLSAALFLPVQLVGVLSRNLLSGKWSVLESYRASYIGKGKASVYGPPDLFDERNLHKQAYDELIKAYWIMGSCQEREKEVTKRWKVTPGPMKKKDRGSVWEGWAAVINEEIKLNNGLGLRGLLMAKDPGGPVVLREVPDSWLFGESDEGETDNEDEHME